MSAARWGRVLCVCVIVSGLGCQAARGANDDEEPRQVTGIGIRPVMHEKGFAIGQIFPDGPAMAAGLREGDVIVAVDGEPTARWTLDRAAARLRSTAGTKVSLVVERGEQRFEVGVIRRTVAVPPQRQL
jgi:carboxyl-terminal processing protease